ncbi:hypothetical protein HMPREF0378_1622 [Eubacterium nodatum ATCC 33099]|nr:hypothetical protein HMPREF0378_1622 [Eubacterium nodatum ATCC 33099]
MREAKVHLTAIICSGSSHFIKTVRAIKDSPQNVDIIKIKK